jgi:transposase
LLFRFVWRPGGFLISLPEQPGGIVVEAYSADLRRRVIADCAAGAGTKAVAAKYSVSASWVRKLKRQVRATGSLEPVTATPGPRPALVAHEGRLRELVGSYPGRTASEYQALLDVDVAVVTVWRAIRRFGLPRNTNPGRRAFAPGWGP